jgi:hypothetical protein
VNDVSSSETSDWLDATPRLVLPVGGREREIRMALRTTGDVVPDVREPHRRNVEDLPFLVLDLIDTIDGEVPGLADAEQICREPQALRVLLSMRNRVWGELRMRGRLYALCPHCWRRESSFELSTLALVLGAAPQPLFEPSGVFLEIPVLADPHVAGRRLAPVPVTPRLRAVLPSGLLGLQPRAGEAVLRDLDTDQGEELEEQAWRRWAPDDRVPPAGRTHWRRGSPGFRSILRLSVALRVLDDDPQVTPERVEGLSVADFFFLDACYYLTHYVDQPRPDALLVSCENCSGSYLPLR